jgi:hypothetical protein
MSSLRAIQKAALFEMLESVDGKVATFVQSCGSSDGLLPDDVVWKVLILDGMTQAMLGPLVKVHELHAHRVTLHL